MTDVGLNNGSDADNGSQEVDLRSLCGHSYQYLPSIAASRDLSRVGMCCLNIENDGLEVLVWK